MAESVADADPEALLPMIDLHDRAREVFWRRGEIEAADQERLTAFLMIELFAERVSTEESCVIAADLFAVHAGGFHSRSPGPSAADLYRRALSFDGTNLVALAGMAHLLESKGRYFQLLPYLELAYAVAPEREETRLRRAINLLRTGRRSEGEMGLRVLIQDGGEDWVMALAVQELARSRIDAGELHSARQIVAKGLSFDSSEPTLVVMSGYLADRLGVGLSESPLETRLAIAVDLPGLSSRYRYSQWSSDLVLDARARCRAAADRARPHLGRALRERDPEGQCR